MLVKLLVKKIRYRRTWRKIETEKKVIGKEMDRDR